MAGILIAGKYALFIRAQLWPLLLGSAIMLILFLAAMILRPGGRGKISGASWLRGLMLLLPLFYMANLLTGSAAAGLNSFALQKRSLGIDNASDSQAFLFKTSGPAPSTKGVLSLAYIATHTDQLMGAHVQTIGRFFHDEMMAPNNGVIYRFVVFCCAADALPEEAVIHSSDLYKVKNDDWVLVGGTVRTTQHNGAQVPFLQVEKLEKIPAPESPYLSPYQF
jgi:uncharacterized repeat protein (TIGR03943 family)